MHAAPTISPALSRRALLRSAAVAALAGIAARDAAASDALKVDFIVTQGTAGLTLADIAFTQGFIRAQNLEAKSLEVSDASKAIAALIGRSSDICLWSGFGGVLAAIERGAALRIVAGSLLSPTDAVYSAKPHIRRIADLAGKTIGVGALGAQLHQVMLAVLRKHGIDAGRVTFRNVGSSTDIFRAVVAGTVDAGPAEIDVFDQQAKYHVHALEGGNLWSELPDFTWQASYTSQDAILRNRAGLVRILAAFGKTYRYVSSAASREAWIASYLKVTHKTDPGGAEAQWRFIQKYHPYAVDLVLQPERVQRMQQLNVELGVQKRVLPFESVADMSLAREAMALIG